jgi:DNA topoisomerase IB
MKTEQKLIELNKLCEKHINEYIELVGKLELLLGNKETDLLDNTSEKIHNKFMEICSSIFEITTHGNLSYKLSSSLKRIVEINDSLEIRLKRKGVI